MNDQTRLKFLLLLSIRHALWEPKTKHENTINLDVSLLETTPPSQDPQRRADINGSKFSGVPAGRFGRSEVEFKIGITHIRVLYDDHIPHRFQDNDRERLQ